MLAGLVSPSCPVLGQGQTWLMRDGGWSRVPCGKCHLASTVWHCLGLVTLVGTPQGPALLMKPLGGSPKFKVHAGQLPALHSALAPHTSLAVAQQDTRLWHRAFDSALLLAVI